MAIWPRSNDYRKWRRKLASEAAAKMAYQAWRWRGGCMARGIGARKRMLQHALASAKAHQRGGAHRTSWRRAALAAKTRWRHRDSESVSIAIARSATMAIGGSAAHRHQRWHGIGGAEKRAM